MSLDHKSSGFFLNYSNYCQFSVLFSIISTLSNMRLVSLSMTTHAHTFILKMQTPPSYIGEKVNLAKYLKPMQDDDYGNITYIPKHQPAIIPAETQQTGTIIFLHGIGHSGAGWSTELSKIRQPYMKIICPMANLMPLSINHLLNTPAWFDKLTLNIYNTDDEEGIFDATTYIHYLIEKEIKSGIASERIILGGFGQGGAVALFAALNFNKKLAGVVNFCNHQDIKDIFPECVNPVNENIPILDCHGNKDPFVNYNKSNYTMTDNFQFVEFKPYFEIVNVLANETEMQEMKKFFKKHIAPS